MNAKDVLRHTIESCHSITDGYINDLKDSDLMVRSVPGSNHIAWQLGHLIGSDAWFLSQVGAKTPTLPPGFEEQHSSEASTSDDPSKFLSLAAYRQLRDATRAAALAALDATPEADLSRPAPEQVRAYCPTVGAMFTLLGTHWLMHAGQFVPIRRVLGKPPLY